MRNPGFIIAAVRSGSGKTLITMGISSLLKKAGLSVQAFKVGPDYIDPGFHHKVTGRPCINLDSWANDEAAISSLYDEYSSKADISIVEGVMGLFDGSASNPKAGSTANIAQILDLPIILVVDGSGMGHSVAAIVHGFENLDKNLNFAGIILNRVGSPKHLKILKESIKKFSSIPVLGYLGKDSGLKLNERYLGLHMAHETNIEFFNSLNSIFSDFSIDQLLGDVKPTKSPGRINKQFSDRATFAPPSKDKKLFMVAQDKAFSFYYHDNLKRIEDAGFEIRFFSPIADEGLPEDTAVVYIGGGYPELYAKELSSNIKMKSSIRAHVENNKPLYAECGGFIYLCSSIKSDGTIFNMIDIFPVKINIAKKTLRYVEVELDVNSILGNKKERLRGHEYHYTQEDTKKDNGPVLPNSISRPFTVYGTDGLSSKDGYLYKNCLGSYIHIFFSSNKKIAESFANHTID